MTTLATGIATTTDQTAEAVQAIRTRGHHILRGILPRELIDACASAFFALHEQRKVLHLPDNRGPHRNYLDAPFTLPFADPRVFENPRVLPIIEALLGPDAVILHLGTDTPELGSTAQDLHADGWPLFPETDLVLPSYVLTMNFPLVDVHLDNGPFEVAEGTHLLRPADALQRIARGEIAVTPVVMQRGDVMIRDPRAIHRGTSNRTPQPRPMVVVSYQRPWVRHPGFEPMRLSPVARDLLSPRGRTLLSLHLNHDHCV